MLPITICTSIVDSNRIVCVEVFSVWFSVCIGDVDAAYHYLYFDRRLKYSPWDVSGMWMLPIRMCTSIVDSNGFPDDEATLIDVCGKLQKRSNDGQ